MLDQVEVLIEETGATVHAPFARLLRAEQARLSGDTSGQERELREALQLFTEVGATGHAERATRWLASLAEPDS